MMKYGSPDEDLQSLHEAKSLPSFAYTAESIQIAERKSVFHQQWIAVGAADQLREVGDYFTCDVGGQPLIIVRSSAGVLALNNVCMHRGTLLCEGTGNTDRFVCPNHGWSYSLQGSLEDSPWFDRVTGFDADQAALSPVAVHTWAGVIFVNFSETPKDFNDIAKQAPARLNLYEMDTLRCVRTTTYEFPGNWKLASENLCEAYHIPYVHGSLESALPLDDFVYQVNNNVFSSWHYVNKQGEPLEVLGEAGRRPVISALRGSDLSTMRYWRLFPNLQLLCSPDHVVVLTVLPRSVSTSTVVASILTVELGAEVEDVWRPLDKAMREDAVIVERMQIGMASNAFDTGRLAVPFENNIFHFHQLLRNVLSEDGYSI